MDNRIRDPGQTYYQQDQDQKKGSGPGPEFPYLRRRNVESLCMRLKKAPNTQKYTLEILTVIGDRR